MLDVALVYIVTISALVAALSSRTLARRGVWLGLAGALLVVLDNQIFKIFGLIFLVTCVFYVWEIPTCGSDVCCTAGPVGCDAY